jgi:polyphosphate kinase 2 (PPK2 family)
MLVRSGVQMFKYYLDISKSVQRDRLAQRREDPLTQWKISPIDKVAQEKWDDYSAARDEMLRRTDHPAAPWTIVRADRKKDARIALISDLLDRLDFQGKAAKVIHPDRGVVFRYSEARQLAGEHVGKE